jgi:hypothetical protein
MTRWNREIALVVGVFAIIYFAGKFILASYLLSSLPSWVWLVSAILSIGFGALFVWARFNRRMYM